MKLLAISYVLPPNQYPQAIQVGRLLYGLDAEVLAVCGTVRSQSRGLDCYPDFDRRLAARMEVPFQPRLSALAFRLAYYGLPLYAKVPDEFRPWVPRAEQAIVRFLEERAIAPDVMVSFGQPMSDHLVGAVLKDRLRLPWVAHFSDPWVDNPFRRQSFVSRTLNRQLEARVIERADHLVFTSAETVELVMRKYPAAWRDKTSILPHGYDPHLYPARAPLEGPLRVRHLGSFYGRRSPEPLFRALRALRRREPSALQDLVIDLVGDVPSRFMRSAALRELPAGLVNVTPNVEYSRSLQMMSDADLLLVIDAPADLSVFLPSKLVDYIGAGQPIFGIVPSGASAGLIARLGGDVADPRDIEQIATGLSRAIRSSRERRMATPLAPWGDPSVREQYAANRVLAQFAATIASVMR